MAFDVLRCFVTFIMLNGWKGLIHDVFGYSSVIRMVVHIYMAMVVTDDMSSIVHKSTTKRSSLAFFYHTAYYYFVHMLSCA